MIESAQNIEVRITEVVRHVEVNLQEGSGARYAVSVGAMPAAVPWSALTSVPANLCVAQVTEDEVSIEFRDLAGNLITRAPFLT